jgi:hypothetical protein
MTDTPNLGLPYIDGSQAQKHVTHNEALRILDAAIQIGVLDLTLTAPLASPAEGERHVVASGATGAWAGRDNAIATWQDGAWAFLAPKTGWCIWSAADSGLFVFDGAAWQSAGGTASFDNVAHLGVNVTASSPNLLSITSNAALFAAIDAADGGTGDMRVQVSKESSTNTASIFFSDNFSGRAEFGLVGADAFKLKVSPDGSAWTEAFTIDQDTGNLTLPRGLSLTGVVSPAQITADQNNYNPAGLAAASVMQINADAARNVSGLASGAEGRCVTVINVGSQPVTFLAESASSSASNRFSLAGNLTIAATQAAILRYDGTAARWQAIAGGAVSSGNAVICPPQGRLTLATGVPVMMSTQSAKTTLIYTLYVGNQIPIYDGTNMVPTAFAELSVATTDTTHSPAAIGASKVNDWFVWNDSGTLRLSHGPDWTNDTTRSAGTALVRVNGIWLNNAAITNGPAASRGTYVGTTRSDASSQLNWILGAASAGGTAAVLGVWNAYNRVQVVTSVTDSTSTWSYTSATIRPFNNSTSNRISYVCGLAEDMQFVSLYVTARPASDSGSDWGDFGWGLNTTTARNSPLLEIGLTKQGVSTATSAMPSSLGFNYLQAVEASNGSTAVLVVGSSNTNSFTLNWRM